MFAKRVISFKSRRFIGVPAVEYPARSPDLFAVADIFMNAQMKDYVYHIGPKPATMAELRAKIMESPVHVTSDVVRKCFQSMPRRAQKCLDAGGDWFAF